MSGHLRFCFAAFVLLAALPTSPASSNPLADFFSTAPAQPTAPNAAAGGTAPAAAEEECLPRPGKSTTAGQRWVYRFDGHRRCWFQTAQGTATVKKQVRHSAAKPPVAASEENESAPRKRKAAVDARAELLRSAPAEASQPIRPAPGLKVVDAASVPATGAAAFVPPAPVEKRATDQLTPDHVMPRVVDVKTLVVAAPAPSDAIAASVPSAPVAFAAAEAADEGQGWMATLLGALLIALGLVAVLGSSPPLREAVLLRD
jgi:hypothetical protein